MEFQQLRIFEFACEASQTVNFEDKIDWRAVLEIHNRVCRDNRSFFASNLLDSHVLPRRKINPYVHIERRLHDALDYCGGHPNQYEPDFFRFKGFQ